MIYDFGFHEHFDQIPERLKTFLQIVSLIICIINYSLFKRVEKTSVESVSLNKKKIPADEMTSVVDRIQDGNMSQVGALSELWELIFDRLSGRQLLDVIQVSREFKEIVEQSSKLMEKLNLTLTKSNLNNGILLRSRRKYKNVIIDGVTEIDSYLKVFLCNQSNSIKSVKITNCDITLAEVQRLLDKVSHNVSVLSMCNVTLITDTPKDTKVNFCSLKKLNILSCNDNTCVNALNMFSSSEIEDFLFMSKVDINDSELKNLKEFLISQKNLINFCMTGDAAIKLVKSINFFEVTALSMLKTLWVELDGESVGEEMMQFFLKQKTTMKVLSLGKFKIDAELMSHLQNFKQLKSLRFCECTLKPLQNYTINTHVNDFSLSSVEVKNPTDEEIICKLLRSMHHVEKLNISSLDITFNIALTMAYDMKRLIHLSFDGCDLNPFTFVNIKRLKFTGGERDAILRMLLVNRQIEWLELEQEHQRDTDFYDFVINKLNLLVKFY